MPDVQNELSTVEQKYFETRGNTPLAEEAPVADTEEIASTGDAGDTAIAADEPADGEANADEPKADESNPGKFVRHGAFHEERERRKKVESDFVAYREQEAARSARLEERLNMLSQTLRRPEPEAQPVDPMVRLAKLEETIQQRVHREQQEQELQQVQQRFFSAVRAKEQEFVQEAPDYYEAVEFARGERMKDILSLGYPEDQAERMLEQDIINISDDAFRRGINPAKRFYDYAKSRGFSKQEAAQVVKEQTATDKIKTIAAGQQAGKSLGSAPGSSQAALSLQALADMPQDEFDKIDAKTWRKMMGG